MMRYEQRQQRKRKKKGKWKKILVVFLLLVAGIFGYSFFQYKKGVSQSMDKAKTNVEEYEFNGEMDKNGGTNILLLGSDARGEENSRSDTIMIARYHPDKGAYKLVSIMRDVYLDIPGHGQNRINTAFGSGGPELLRETIKENFDVDLQYYAIVDFQGFVQLVDEAFPNGVEVNVEKQMSENIGVTIEPGLQYLDGEHLLGYVRFRHDAIGDFGRVKRQQEVVQQIGKQITSIQTLPKLPKLLGVVTPFINTNMDSGDMLYIGKDFLTKKNRSIDTLTIPVDGSWEDARIGGAAVLSIDLEKNKAAIHDFLSE
jgi:LCP family protein required for cell wall assembly